MAKIYTRTGDDGTTGLIGGKRVPKNSHRMNACGSLDELNAVLGMVRSHALPAEVDETLRLVQSFLFTMGTELATPEEADPPETRVLGENVRWLEESINLYEKSLSPLKKFILPGGSPSGAALHLARAVTRRAERCCVTLARHEKINPQIVAYLNRLSDLCFVLARYVNRDPSMPEFHPTIPAAD